VTTFLAVECVVAAAAVAAAVTGADATRILLALIALGGVYLSRKVREIHVLVNAQLEKVMQRLDVAIAERDAAQTAAQTGTKKVD
jgi:hypothetical protein